LKRRHRGAVGNVGSLPMSRPSYWMIAVAFRLPDLPEAIQ